MPQAECSLNFHTGKHGAQEAELSETDMQAAHTLVDEKYATEAWTKRVP